MNFLFQSRDPSASLDLVASKEIKEKEERRENLVKRENEGTKELREIWEKKVIEDCQDLLEKRENPDRKVLKEVKAHVEKLELLVLLGTRAKLDLQVFLVIPEDPVKRETRDSKEAMGFQERRENGEEMVPSVKEDRLDQG